MKIASIPMIGLPTASCVDSLVQAGIALAVPDKQNDDRAWTYEIQQWPSGTQITNQAKLGEFCEAPGLVLGSSINGGEQVQ